MSDLRVGLVGAGMVSRFHATAWHRCRDARLVAVADPDIDAAAARAGTAARAYGSLGEMLAAGGIDAVDIAAPVGSHKALVLQAARAGCPVLCQKPLAATAAEAAHLIAALPAGARVMLHENWRWRQPYRQLKAWLERQGTPGRFCFSVVSSGLLPAADGSFPALRRQPFLAGLERLLVFELMHHHLDVCHYLFGPSDVVEAQRLRRCPAVRGEDFARIGLRCGEAVGSLTGDLCCDGAPPLPEDRLSFAEGPSWLLTGWRLEGLDAASREWNGEDAYQASYTDCIAHFAHALATGSAFETPIEHGLRLLQQVERVYALSDASGAG